MSLVVAVSSAEAQEQRPAPMLTGLTRAMSGGQTASYPTAGTVPRRAPAAQRPSAAGRFASQLAADRDYIRRYRDDQVTPAAYAESTDPRSGEPVVDYDQYVANQSAAGTAPFIVADELAPYSTSVACGGCGNCNPCDTCPPMADCYDDCRPSGQCWQPRLWVDGGYLLWSVKGFSTPPLVTQSPAGTAREVAGVLGEPTTTILFGGNRLAEGARSGGRINFGLWIDPYNTWAVEATYLGLATESDNFAAASAGGAADPILARPFFNVEAGFEGQDAELIAFPGLLSGNVQVHAETSFYGMEVLMRRRLAQSQNYSYDFLAGWRFNRLDDSLVIHDFKTSLDDASGLVLGTTIDETDAFGTKNWFNGAEIGVVAKRRWGYWLAEATLKLALGGTHSEATINGSTTTTVPLPGGGTDVSVTDAGLLAQQTNIGTYSYDQFSVIPELGVALGYNLTSHLQAKVGYTFLYWSRVARAGDQIDTDLNLTQLDPGGLVGNPRPRFNWVFDDVWAQGLTLGLDYTF